MRDSGELIVCKLQNIAEIGYLPKDALVSLFDCYYAEMTVGASRFFSALGNNQRIDKLVRCFNSEIPYDASHVVLADGYQYKIIQAQQRDDHCDLTIQRSDESYDIK